MYNFLSAFVICGIVVILGEAISNLTKAWVPSVFASACILLVGYWTVLPYDLVKDSYLIPFGATIAIYLLIVHMGTVASVHKGHNHKKDRKDSAISELCGTSPGSKIGLLVRGGIPL